MEMKKFLQKKLKNEKGMTLIELLAVIVIIAIIAAIAIPAIANIIENSRVGASKSDALSAFAAAELYYAENGDAFVAGGDGITTTELTDGGYLDDLGSFTAAAGPSFTQNGAGELLLDGATLNGGVTLTFDDATKSDVTGLSNSAGNTAAGATSTITVSGR